MASVDEAIGRVRALKPGKTEIKVLVAGQTATVPVEVTNEEITELTANPAALEMAAGEHAHLQVFGRAATSGLKEMFPQPDLKVAPEKGGTVDVIGGEDVQAKAIGKDTINVAWRDKLKIAVPVKVAANTITDLQINPAPEKTINIGQAVTYEVSGMRGGNRVILTPDRRRAVECHRSSGRERGRRHDRRHAPAPDKPRWSPISPDKRPRLP